MDINSKIFVYKDMTSDNEVEIALDLTKIDGIILEELDEESKGVYFLHKSGALIEHPLKVNKESNISMVLDFLSKKIMENTQNQKDVFKGQS